MAITSIFLAATQAFSRTFGDNLDNTITVSRNAAGQHPGQRRRGRRHWAARRPSPTPA